MENILGILGGMGPMASNHFAELLIKGTKASCDREHINFIMINHADMPDRTSAILAGDTKEITELMLSDMKTLEALGCRAICITCNTAHYFAHRLEPELGIPVISLIRETAKEMGLRHKGEKVGILATDGTIKTRIYQDALEAQGVIPVAAGEQAQKLVMHLIYDCVKAGRTADVDAAMAVENEMKSLGCEEVLLACTELPLLCREGIFDDPFYYTDPMQVMADRAIEFMGKERIRRR